MITGRHDYCHAMRRWLPGRAQIRAQHISLVKEASADISAYHYASFDEHVVVADIRTFAFISVG